MKNVCFVFFVAVMSICTMACSDNEQEGVAEPSFEISEELLQQDFTKEQSSILVPVSTNLESAGWSVSSTQSWCLVAKDLTGSKPAVKIVIQASEEPEVRSAAIEVKSSVKNYTIQVRQLGYGPAILVRSEASVESAGGPLQITVTSNVEYTITQSASTEWLTTIPRTRALVDKDYAYEVAANTTYEARTAVLAYTAVKESKVMATCAVIQKAKKSDTSDVVLEGDVKIQPTSGKDSEHQPGQGIENTFDGKIGSGSPYHSIWNQSATFPVILEYFFDGTNDMDYFIYHTRSGNGNFGELDVYTATEENPEYALYGSFDFKKQNASSKVVFASTLKKVTKIKFAVKSGAGDFVSCDEMEFFRKNTSKELDAQLLTVFTDITCCELKQGVTSEQINALPGYFAHLAVQLKNGTYDAWEKKFRMQDYQAYSDVEVWAEKLMTKRYGNLDNPTGIYAEAGDSIIVLVGDTHGQTVSLQAIPAVDPSGDMYFLNEGVNKVGIRQTGMLFVMYTTPTVENMKPIRVHIPLNSGKVNGFFDLKEDKTDEIYADLLSKATYKYFCVRGEKIMFYFHLTKMREYLPRNILSAIHLWDNIIGWQQELMGIDNVRPSQVNNHIFAVSPEDGYMWASDYRIGFVYTYLNNILLYDNVMAAKDNAWGPSHEIGHIHQKAINWPSSTESSNNLFSNYVLYKLGKYCSRGTELSALATARFIEKQAWFDMGSSTHQNEDTELHMRMNWQLWNYYHRCGYKPDFWQKLFKLLRETRITESDPGAGQLLFAKMASKAANENLTDFFELWGFFIPVNNVTIEQYGTWKYNVTQTMINEAKSYMAQFPKAKHAFYYLEDRKNGDVGIENYKVGDVGHYTQFKNNQTITKTVGYTRSGQRITISGGDEAVAFEIKRGAELLFFSNFLSFEVPSQISLDVIQVYAVQADGKRVQAILK
ncbi:MAG: carbohydrate-binding protein [Bacteroides sp.]|nr:carbohydrate-binding protein [Bacteroides sp.]